LTYSELDGIPGFNQDDEQNPPEKVVELKKRVRQADGILFVTPEYNYSVPGALKNAIDWASRPYGESVWNGKPAAIMRASIGAIGTARAQYHLRQIFVFLNMFPVNQPEVMIANAASRLMRKAISPTRQQRSIFESYFRRLSSGLREFRCLSLDESGQSSHLRRNTHGQD
jgi:chromate reductase, NAD(P)H dehydrogenase (quinone)